MAPAEAQWAGGAGSPARRARALSVARGPCRGRGDGVIPLPLTGAAPAYLLLGASVAYSAYATWRAARHRSDLEIVRRELQAVRPAAAPAAEASAGHSSDIATLAGRVSELARSEESFRVLVESVTDAALFTLSATGEVASWNSGAERIFGYREAEILGRHIRCFYPEAELSEGRPRRPAQHRQPQRLRL